ncbi:MAG: hypothetical protein HF560_04695 [Synechococcus sp. MIT S9220]|uniref:hypothetical protein n=1 Tax=unclassified Synechococcus TaxID=2626047 RepID=UPI0017F3E009|nr:hypothetical protein [Synechococcus sp. MIT S9220]
MSKSNTLLSTKQLSIITFFAAVLALVLSSSSSHPLISFIIWIILLFSFFSISVLVITLMARGAKGIPSKSPTTKRRNSYMDESDRLNYEMYEYEQDSQDDRCDSGSSDSGSSSCDSSSD